MTKRSTDDLQSSTFKRVNSKEEMTEEDIVAHPRKLHPTLRELASRTRVFSSGRIKDITLALSDHAKRERALAATKQAHCSESLQCLISILDWETLDDGEAKVAGAHGIVEKYIKDDTDAICVPDSLRTKIMSEDSSYEDLVDSIEEVKKLVLNDLRFNGTLLQALNSTG